MSDNADPAVRIGTAGWSIPAQFAGAFSAAGSHLQRYASRFIAAEINSSFYKPHRPATYARWAASVPDGFQFAVKLPRDITHDRRLGDAGAALDRFLGEVVHLGPKLGPVLVQLPPSLAFDPAAAASFFDAMRTRFESAVVCEPRHSTWFDADADALLRRYQVARVAADPACVTAAAKPGGWPGLTYYRLHGSPRIYHSAYEPGRLDQLAPDLAAQAGPFWCIFDNTARGAATGDALALTRMLD